MMASTIFEALGRLPNAPDIQFNDVLSYVRLACLAKPTIEQSQKTSSPPAMLPQQISTILAAALGWKVSVVDMYWSVLAGVVYEHPSISPTENEVNSYNKHALDRETSYRHMYPPVRSCQNSECTNFRRDGSATLSKPTTHKASLFTLSEGALPIYTTSLYCRACHRRYYHDYYVHKDTSTRTYYEGVPDVLQVAQHFFIETSLLEFFANGKVFGWLSGTNCARIYNYSLRLRNSHIMNNALAFPTFHAQNIGANTPREWQSSLFMRSEDVLNGFFLYSLLLDKAERTRALILPHDELAQKFRLQPALEERNKAMEGIGQESYPHACDLCFIVKEGPDGKKYKLQAAVTDGNTIGHPCCAVHDCKVSLASHHHRFCPEHAALNLVCAITTCSALRDTGFRTCADPSHRSLEKAYFSRGSAFFQLRSKLKKAGIAVPTDSVPLNGEKDGEIGVGLGPGDDEVGIEEEEEGCDSKPVAGNRKLKAYFGRRRTHSDQLILRNCGIIISRATFFGSEAISSVADFMLAVFPSEESTPEYFVYDNACSLDKHLRAQGDTHFGRTALPVDVFHFRSKHKDTDTHCQTYCNPASFPELYDENGKWIFNTSICEQTNVWFGGYLAIVRDMEATRYNFYLDEMIKRRNRYVIAQLMANGHNPWTIPMDALFPLLFGTAKGA